MLYPKFCSRSLLWTWFLWGNSCDGCLRACWLVRSCRRFSYLCLGESALVAVGSFLTSSWLKDSSKEWRTLRFALKGIFGFVVVAIMTIALHFFIDEATTDKSKSPEKSRDLNKECAWANFFDDHDKWHILSSFGLFMGALMLIHLSYKLPKMSSGTPPEPKSRPPQ